MEENKLDFSKLEDGYYWVEVLTSNDWVIGYWDGVKWDVPNHQSIIMRVGDKVSKNAYDSKADTLLHIKRVNELLGQAASELIRRGSIHDNSKLESPEKELFDKFTPKLAGCTYGSDEYKGFLKELRVALLHHYKNNSHHPEHYDDGVNGMDLFDVIEMFFDWKAASERHGDGDIMKSLGINQDRFGISEQLGKILINTANRLGYNKDKKSRCCGRCDGINDLCVSDTVCDKHNEMGCEECYGKREIDKSL